MKKMKFFKLAAAATALMAGAGAATSAHAEGTITGNVTIASDYVFRGISQTQGGPAIQGGFDYANGIFYAGTWASNVASSTISSGGIEMDLYAGVAPTVGPVALNFGVIGYFYPGADDEGAETNYYEAKASASFSPIESLTLTGSLFYSPEFSLELGEAIYYELAAGFAVSDTIGLKASIGEQDIDEISDSYTTWSVGGTYAYSGFTFGLTYSDTDDAFEAGAAVEETDSDEAITFSISRAL
ncbi:MAG: TorF family putative porin [Hyphomonadaceae bacterium]|nr:TorF family putative porin [Hyphomonadaceae bacterium]